jgi:lysophospholipase L1-like esterase
MPVAGCVFVRFSNVCRALVVGISGIAAVGAGQAATLAWTYRSPPECRGPSHGLESVHQQGVPRVVVFLGDSLVTGVGCTCQSNPGTNCIHGGPVLARRLAKRLASTLSAPVEWHAVGMTGASVRDLVEHVLPRASREVNQEPEPARKIDMVVILCGVNDWKRAWRSYSPSAFEEGLAALIGAARKTLRLSPDCSILLPAVNGSMIEHVPKFQMEPLRSMLAFVAEQYDSAKRRVAARFGDRVRYIPALSTNGEAPTALFSHLDGVHPNEVGYQKWADHIFDQANVKCSNA